jgi:hypothetical protein
MANIGCDLKDVDWTFRSEDARPNRHGMHLYPATMHASYVSKFLDCLVSKQGVVLDPFGGSGTVALECVKRQIEVYSNDLNPLARLIMESKLINYAKDFGDVIATFLLKLEEQKRVGKSVVSLIKETAFSHDLAGQKEKEQDEVFFNRLNELGVVVPRFKNLAYWFQPEVAYALNLIKSILPIESFFKVCFSECVRVVSNRRAGEFKLFRRPAETLLSYSPDVFEVFEKIVKRNWKLVCDCTIPDSKYHITSNDARDLKDVPNDSAELVITSPPYGDSRTTVAYGQFSRLSLQWLDVKDANQIDNILLGGNKANDCELSGSIKAIINGISIQDEARAKEVQRFFCDLYKSFESIDEKTLSKGYHVWVVGNRMVKGTRVPLDLFIQESGKSLGYKVIDTLYRDITNKSMPSQNSPSNIAGNKVNTMTQESIVILQKE